MRNRKPAKSQIPREGVKSGKTPSMGTPCAAWGHINMLGEYDFSEEKLRDALGILPPKSGA